VNRSEPIPWRGFRTIDKLIILLLPWPAILILLLPLLDLALLRRLARQPGMRPLVTWLINDGGSWILGGGLLVVALAVLWWLRHRLVNDKRLWYGTGCPACGERELVRVSRQFGDRFYGLIFVPAYRYACRNCTWRGLRIARREHSRQSEAELEAALLRFDPDALPADRAVRRGEAIFRDAGDVTHLDGAYPDGTNPDGYYADEALSDGSATLLANDTPDDLPSSLPDDLPDDIAWIWSDVGDGDEAELV